MIIVSQRVRFYSRVGALALLLLGFAVLIYLTGRDGSGHWLPFLGQDKPGMAPKGAGKLSARRGIDGPKALKIAKEWVGPQLIEWAREVRTEQVHIDSQLLAENPENIDINMVQDSEKHTGLKPGSGTDPWLVQFIGIKGLPPRRYVFYVLIDGKNGEIIHVGVAGGGAGELK